MNEDITWYAINEIELKGFHFAALIAGGGETVSPVIEKIQNRVIDFHTKKEEVKCSLGQQNARL